MAGTVSSLLVSLPTAFYFLVVQPIAANTAQLRKVADCVVELHDGHRYNDKRCLEKLETFAHADPPESPAARREEAAAAYEASTGSSHAPPTPNP